MGGQTSITPGEGRWVTIQLTETEHKLLVDMLERASAHVCEGLCRKVKMKTSAIFTFSDLRSQGVKLFRRRLEGSPRAGQSRSGNEPRECYRSSPWQRGRIR